MYICLAEEVLTYFDFSEGDNKLEKEPGAAVRALGLGPGDGHRER